MLPTIVLTTILLVAAAPTSSCFAFTAPAAGAALNLSASAIVIQWSSNDSQYSEVDLSFVATSVSGDVLTYSIAQNISLTENQYEWQPSDVSKALQATQIKLKPGNDFTFKADLHTADSNAGQTVSSDGYTITGYPYIGAAASLRPHTGSLFLTLVFLAVIYRWG